MNAIVHIEALTPTQRASLAYTLARLQQEREYEEDTE